MIIYSNDGNAFVIDRIPAQCRRLLDVGCGTGDNARLIRRRFPGIAIEGITYNEEEAARSADAIDRVHVLDLEQEGRDGITGSFDCLLFSHVLEHMQDPERVLMSFLPFLVDGGTIVIAVPNVLEWRTRLRLLKGDWRYGDSGILDRTHMRFFTYNSIEDTFASPRLRPVVTFSEKAAHGAVPLWPLRRIAAASPLLGAIDRLGVRLFPNLFGSQIVLVGHKSAAP